MIRLRMMGLAMATAFCTAQANAEELTGTLKKVKETGTITIGYRDSSIPFSYLDDNQKPVGYAMDICYKIVDAVKKELKLDKLEVKLNPVTSSTRIPCVEWPVACCSPRPWRVMRSSVASRWRRLRLAGSPSCSAPR